MFGRLQSGPGEAGAVAYVRRLAIALVGAAQLAVIPVGPLADTPPAPSGHVQHIGADTAPGCHPFHDDHCVVCRVLSTEALPGATEAAAAPRPPLAPLAALAATGSLDAAGPFDRLHARAPPIA